MSDHAGTAKDGIRCTSRARWVMSDYPAAGQDTASETHEARHPMHIHMEVRFRGLREAARSTATLKQSIWR